MSADTNKKVYIILTILVLIGVFVLSFLVLNGFSNLKNAPSNLTTQGELSQFPVDINMAEASLELDKDKFSPDSEREFFNIDYMLNDDYSAYFKAKSVTVSAEKYNFNYTFDFTRNDCSYNNGSMYKHSGGYGATISHCNVVTDARSAEIIYELNLEYRLSNIGWTFWSASFRTNNPLFTDGSFYKTKPVRFGGFFMQDISETYTHKRSRDSTWRLSLGGVEGASEDVTINVKGPYEHSAFRPILSISSGSIVKPIYLVPNLHSGFSFTPKLYYQNITFSEDTNDVAITEPANLSEYNFLSFIIPGGKSTFYTVSSQNDSWDLRFSDRGVSFFRIYVVEESSGVPAYKVDIPVISDIDKNALYESGVNSDDYISIYEISVDLYESAQKFGKISTYFSGNKIDCNSLNNVPVRVVSGEYSQFPICAAAIVQEDIKSPSGQVLVEKNGRVPISLVFYVQKTTSEYKLYKYELAVHDNFGEIIYKFSADESKSAKFGHLVLFEDDFDDEGLISSSNVMGDILVDNIYAKLFSNTTSSNGLDNNNDGKVDILDIINLIKYVFGG